MHDLLKFLSPDSENDKIYCLNGLRESGSNVIAFHCVQYAMERNDQIYGAYEIDAQNQFNTKGLISKIANKLGLVRDNEDQVIEMLDQQDTIMVINNMEKLIKLDKAGLFKMLYNFVSKIGKSKLKIILITFQSSELKLDDDILQYTKQNTIKPLVHEYACKMMFQLNKNYFKFTNEYKDYKTVREKCQYIKYFASDMYPQRITIISDLI